MKENIELLFVNIVGKYVNDDMTGPAGQKQGRSIGR